MMIFFPPSKVVKEKKDKLSELVLLTIHRHSLAVMNDKRSWRQVFHTPAPLPVLEGGEQVSKWVGEKFPTSMGESRNARLAVFSFV